ncbi:MAG: FHA domain-containing protein [Chloroflexi bacterium]|nr:FHA domain-containing protein [Chloroflexota bacterium]
MTEPVPPLWVIELNAPQMSKPLKLRVEERVVLGRSVSGESKQPDVDLAAYQAEDLGVSRQHLALFPEGDRLMLEDLGSGNGTLLNTTRLKPGEPQPLSHGDHLYLGRLRLDVQIILSPTFGSSARKQASLQLHDQALAGTGQLILIVEDDYEVARALAQVMEQAGYKARISHDVVSAIRLYNQKAPEAVIVEQLLPEINGLEFCRYVRRDVHGNSLPMVVISASKVSSNIPEVMGAGADIFLDRPVSAKELRHVISSLINRHQSGHASIYTKHLVGTAPLQGMPPESRRNAVVLFVAGHSDTPIPLIVTQPVSFGRANSTGSLKSHVDLTRFDAVNYGVSRLHMILHQKDGKFFVEDMDTINGTYINGDPSKPRELVPVKNGDEIRLGQLRMYIYFLQDPEPVRP